MVIFSSFYHGGGFKNAFCLNNACYLVSTRVYGDDCKGGEIINPIGKTIEAASGANQLICRPINLDFEVAHSNWNDERITEMEKTCGASVSVQRFEEEERVLIVSHGARTAEDIAHAFNIELIDDDLDRARALRAQALQDGG